VTARFWRRVLRVRVGRKELRVGGFGIAASVLSINRSAVVFVIRRGFYPATVFGVLKDERASELL
jgi:hypothetical protein